jgi:hypothetical protein
VNEEQPYTFAMVPRTPYCHRNVIEDIVFAKTNPVNDAMPWSSTQTGG